MVASSGNYRIAIIGAGPSGLTLAALLVKQNVSVSIYERDADVNARSQGGILDLHPDGAQLALSAADLMEEFIKNTHVGGEDFKMATGDMRILIDEKAEDAGKGGRPEIDRVVLRNMLVEAAGAQNISWGRYVTAVKPSKAEDNKFDIHFKDGTVEGGFKIVVGADGGRSKVRPLVTDIKPFYSGVSAVSLMHFPVNATNARHANLASLVRRGSAFGFTGGKGIQAQRLGDNSIKVYCTFKVADENWIKKFDHPEDYAKVRGDLLAEYADWHADWRDAIELSDDDKNTFMAWPLYMLPVGHRWEQRKGVTLIGDAAHLFTPHAGEGANIAMVDALELSKAIISGAKGGDGSFYAAVRDFEVKMFERAKESASLSTNNMEILHSENFPETAKELIEIMTAGGPPPNERGQ